MSDRQIIKPHALSGFPEWLPAEKLVERRILSLIADEFERFGFSPIETPAVEHRDVLTAKGVAEKEIYLLSRLAAAEGQEPTTEMALHFDLTVPLARYVAQHFPKLTFPFRRYQIQKVWRGERPQAGRFREFYQCDIDIVGNGSLSLINDAEIPCVIHSIFQRMGIGDFVIRINNRKILTGLMTHLAIAEGAVAPALRAVDSLEKVGHERVRKELTEGLSLTGEQADTLLAVIGETVGIDELGQRDAGALYAKGVEELAEVLQGMRAFGLPESSYQIDLSIARGLDYYTGTVYETNLVERPDIGSVCSGGRYDELASNYTRQHLPGVGISIGLTRLLSRLFEAGLLRTGPTTPAPVLVTVLERDRLADYLAIASDLRHAGIGTELFTEPKKLAAQLKYADQKGFTVAVIAGGEELDRGEVNLKWLAQETQLTCKRTEVVSAIRHALAGGQ